MHHAFHFCLISAACAAAAAAQTNFIGFSYNVETTATSRFSVGASAGEVMTVIKGEEYAGWGTATPGFRTVASVFMVIQDQDAVTTPETFDVLLYPESLATPGTPDLTMPITFMLGVTGPPAPTTGVISAAFKIITPATPVPVPIVGTGDVFVSFRFAANAGWTAGTDGLSAHANYGYSPGATFTVFDVPGSNQQPVTPVTVNNTHCFSRVGAGAIIINQRRTHIIDIAHDGPGGAVMGITNQASALGSANPPPAGFGPAPGTASFQSGCAPDVTGVNPGRVDDITFDYFRGTPAANSFVIFFADFGAFPAVELPLSVIFPGSTGNICVNSTFFQLGSGLADANGEAFLVTTFPAAVRPLAAGLQIIQQALEVDFVGGVFHLSPCGRQQL
jgi:hypothetical protein